MASEYDIIVIGGGPSGLSAVSSIVRQDHKTVLFDSGKYRNGTSQHMHTVATWDHKHPGEFRAAARANLERYGSVKIEPVEVDSAKKLDDGRFQVEAGGKAWIGKKLILATGVEDIFPDIPGYEDCWISGIFHCLYCHGWEEIGTKSAGVLAEGDCGKWVVALHVARQTLRMADAVTIYTNGNEELGKELEDALKAGPAPMTVDTRKIAKLVKGSEGAQVTLQFVGDEGNSSKTEGFLAHKPKTKLRGTLAEQLGLEITPMSTIKVNPPFNQTSVKGVFAAGDCSSPMQTVTAALHSGTCTGGGAPLQIQAETYGQPAIF